MKIEIDVRPTSPKFIVDGHELDITSVRATPDVSVESESGITVNLSLFAEEVTFTDIRGVTFHVDKERAITISGTDEAAVRQAAGVPSGSWLRDESGTPRI